MSTNEIIKICARHGQLTINDIKIWNYRNKIYRRCKKCIQEKNKRWLAKKRLDSEWVKNKKENDKKFWQENKERITNKRKQPEKLKKRRDSYAENADQYRKRDREKKNIEKNCMILT